MFVANSIILVLPAHLAISSKAGLIVEKEDFLKSKGILEVT